MSLPTALHGLATLYIVKSFGSLYALNHLRKARVLSQLRSLRKVRKEQSGLSTLA